jgi:hypothetical protein
MTQLEQIRSQQLTSKGCACSLLLCTNMSAVCVCAQVTDAGGERLNFARGRWLDLDGGIIAAPPAVHAAVLAAVQSVRSSSQAKA